MKRQRKGNEKRPFSLNEDAKGGFNIFIACKNYSRFIINFIYYALPYLKKKYVNLMYPTEYYFNFHSF